jgi:hypothetical protein
VDAAIRQVVHALRSGGKDGVGYIGWERIFEVPDLALGRLAFIEASGIEPRRVVPVPTR